MLNISLYSKVKYTYIGAFLFKIESYLEYFEKEINVEEEQLFNKSINVIYICNLLVNLQVYLPEIYNYFISFLNLEKYDKIKTPIEKYLKTTQEVVKFPSQE